MERYTSFILKHRKMIIVVFVFLAVVCAGLSTKVGVNYKFADYLPDDAASTVALDTMKKRIQPACTKYESSHPRCDDPAGTGL